MSANGSNGHAHGGPRGAVDSVRRADAPGEAKAMTKKEISAKTREYQFALTEACAAGDQDLIFEKFIAF